MADVSVGVIVYNEAKNIAKLLRAVQKSKLNNVTVKEIIVVSSACTDGTDDIVEDFAKSDDRIILIKEPERRGKSAAINLFLAKASSEYCIIESGDTIPAPDTIEKMVTALTENNTGMSGGRPVPENYTCTFIGFAVQLLWRLHHKMALISPKLGEMIAFRNIVKEIPEESAVDEASIESEITKAGLRKKYIPDAIIHNKGPETLSDFISQRRRIAAGHLWLKEQYNYKVSSQNSSILFRIMIDEILQRPLTLPYILLTAGLEIYSRFLGRYDYCVKKKNPFKWDIAETTKNLRRKD
ncbi:MAG: hypothetical protein CSB55_02900 [Candidatus Cloacimonadota bacterium]|nr:MAG: hypothetical protein CSB55_02900 [Candidatus Cloacimonadota bacterium]